MIGDFNYWDGTGYPMRSLGSSGVWELFVPGIGAGQRYKYEILGRDGVWRQKADPLAQQTETPPDTASVINVRTTSGMTRSGSSAAPRPTRTVNRSRCTSCTSPRGGRD